MWRPQISKFFRGCLSPDPPKTQAGEGPALGENVSILLENSESQLDLSGDRVSRFEEELSQAVEEQLSQANEQRIYFC